MTESQTGTKAKHRDDVENKEGKKAVQQTREHQEP